MKQHILPTNFLFSAHLPSVLSSAMHQKTWRALLWNIDITAQCKSLDYVEASHRHRVYPLMYCHMDISGHLNINRLNRSVSLSSKAVPEIMSAYDFKKGKFVNLGYTVNDVVKCVEQFVPLMRPDLSCSPQLRILIKSKEEHDLVIVIMSHILADGTGFLQYLYLLAAIYNGKQIDRNIQNMRDISPLLENIHILAPTQQTKHHRRISVSPLRPKEKSRQFFCLTSQIPTDRMTAIYQKAKQYGATLNDVFMTAYARVIARLQNIDTVILPCPADLRKFHPGLHDLTVANMTGIYRKLLIEIPSGCSFTMTLQQVHLEMELQKYRNRCFAGIKILNRTFHKMPRPLLGMIIKATYRLLPVSYTNLGIINHEKLYFKDCIIQNCFFTGTYRLPPDFQLTISTFQNVCTLNCTLLGTDNSKRAGQRLLELIKQEIFNWIV